MSKKTKFDYEMEQFNEAFVGFEDKKIVIYGTGRLTATLIEYNTRFDIIGLCDREESMIGTLVYGLPVLSREEAEQHADIVIINTGSSYWNTIFKRIKDWNIPIYFRDGQLAVTEKNTYSSLEYWNESLDELTSKIYEHDIISFDIFDTILMRQVMSPLDVFRIVEKKLKVEWGLKANDYIPARKVASSRLANPSLMDLFDEIRRITGWSKDESDFVMQLELEVEMDLIIPRKAMVDLCNRLMKEKTVYFVSDMYYDANTLCRFLNQVGVDADSEKIYVSCDIGADKASGGLWEWYKNNIVKERKAIHIGDNYSSDYLKPMEYGIDSYYVMSVADMLNNSSLGDVSSKVVSIHSSIALANICSAIFDNPFALNNRKGMVTFETNEAAGYSIFGDIAYCFAMWLAEESRKDEIDSLGFFARDGYFLYRQYMHMAKLFSNDNWVRAFYIEISRRTIWGTMAVSREGILKVAKFPYNGTVYEFYKNRFGIEIESDEKDYEWAEIQNNKERFEENIDFHINELLERGNVERKNYISYLNTIEFTENAGIVDSSLYGSTQYNLQKLMGRKFFGYYMCACLDNSNEYISENDMKGCFQKEEDLAGKECAINKYADFVESFYTAPNGMIQYINDNGEAVYGRQMTNQIMFDVRLKMEKGILDYCTNIANVYKRLHINPYEIDAVFADCILESFMNEGFEPTNDMRKGFYYDNGAMHYKESPIWG